MSFHPQQPSLHLKSPAKPAQPPITGDDTVAGDDDKQGIATQCLPYRPRRPRLANLLRYPEIAPRFAEGNEPGCLPDPLLKGCCAREVELIREISFLAAEVSLNAFC